jgi:hypothetical protein
VIELRLTLTNGRVVRIKGNVLKLGVARNVEFFSVIVVAVYHCSRSLLFVYFPPRLRLRLLDIEQ